RRRQDCVVGGAQEDSRGLTDGVAQVRTRDTGQADARLRPAHRSRRSAEPDSGARPARVLVPGAPGQGRGLEEAGGAAHLWGGSRLLPRQAGRGAGALGLLSPSRRLPVVWRWILEGLLELSLQRSNV